MTQRPELFQVAIPAVGVLDMLRYHTFTSGAGWAYDYGTSEQSKEMFEYLYKYFNISYFLLPFRINTKWNTFRKNFLQIRYKKVRF